MSGDTQPFTATGTYSDESTSNVTSQATWASSKPEVATINNVGLATGLSTGETTIAATLDGVVGSTTLTVQPAPLSITTTALPNGVSNIVYTATLTANGGRTPYTWSMSGILPAGLTFNASGVISGTPSRDGDVQLHCPGARCRQSDGEQGAEPVHRVAAVGSHDLAEHRDAGARRTAGRTCPVELGVKFKSDAAGTITGLRFYKHSANTGSHTGNLWSISGRAAGHGDVQQ